jgi:hypothetical protein
MYLKAWDKADEVWGALESVADGLWAIECTAINLDAIRYLDDR